MDRDLIISLIRDKMKYAEGRKGLAVLWSAATATALLKAGTRAIVQAGTCHWPRLPIGQAPRDKKDHPTFGYTWDKEDSLNVSRFMSGTLPKMHIWVAIPETEEVIDFTCKEFPDACKETTGLDWAAPKPPDVFWGTIGSSDWPEGVLYIPDPIACHLAVLALVAIAQVGEKDGSLPYLEGK